VTDRKNGRSLFDRPKPTMGCRANGRRRILNVKSNVIQQILAYENYEKWVIHKKNLSK
jgi:hypothetical protein